MTNRQLNLNAFIYPTGHHEASWRHPGSVPERLYDVTYFQELARLAESAKLDAVFFADGPALRTEVKYRPTTASNRSPRWSRWPRSPRISG